MRRGLSSVVGGLILVALAVMILSALLTVGVKVNRDINVVRSLGSNLRFLASSVSVQGYWNTSLDGRYRYLNIRNVGVVRAWLKYLLLHVNASTVVLNMYDFVRNATLLKDEGIKIEAYSKLGNETLPNGDGLLYLDPQGYLLIRLTSNYTPTALILAHGQVVQLSSNVSQVSNVSSVAGSVIVYPIDLADILTGILTNNTIGNTINVSRSQIQQPLPGNLGTGMERYHTYLILAYNFSNVRITLSGSFNGVKGFWYGMALVGLDPVWTRLRLGAPKYTIGLTTFMPGCYRCNVLTVAFPNGTRRVFHMDYDFSYGWRMIVLGFTPSTSSDLELRYYNPKYGINVDSTGTNAIGIWWDYGERKNYENNGEAWIYANGTAKQVLIYEAVPTNKLIQFSYRPYFLTMDVDNDGIPEFIFSTEDAGPGYAGTCNDYALTSWTYPSEILMDDWSVQPFWVNITGYQFSGLKYAMVTVTIRVYFHDDLGDDVDEVDYANRTIFGIYLIGSDGKVYSSREYDYQELAQLEDTYPPNRNFFIMTVPLLVPDLNESFHIGIAFQDPYDDCYHTYYGAGDTGYDDGDFTIAIEWLGITFYARP